MSTIFTKIVRGEIPCHKVYEDDARLLGGVNWRPLARGTIRAAVSVGLTDGAPDAAIVAGYAVAF